MPARRVRTPAHDLLTEQRKRAERFHALHVAGNPLVLVNAFDVGSAKRLAKEGAPAIATSSYAVAESLGFADGEHTPIDAVLRMAERICAQVEVPVTIDFEAGYGDTPRTAANSVRQLVATGVVGINLEDGLVGGERRQASIEAHAAKIHAVRRAADRAGVPLFINARIDNFMLARGKAPSVRDVLARARAYQEAGASGIFVPRLADLDTIAHIADSIDAPLNVLAEKGFASLRELAAAGVARVSLGDWPYALALDTVAAKAREYVAPPARKPAARRARPARSNR